ncbi:FeoB-associated Cys-rich membrane protein [Desertivirga arenae]|uniref:FeoB-associated Cys-rich membrane protein n=1 Tax=Desertivirga arenae TaxID=2810309 RepID=UPI001A965277|nr:FeoB-associated Cys-rich membrane protein [Pedobacter sp. SYSU D00823]
MELQELLVAALFLIAVSYIGRSIYRNARPQNGCGTSCKCGIDFSEIEKESQD